MSTPANAGSSERRKSCSHTLSVIRSGAGFFARREASSRMPPVSRKRYSPASSVPLYVKIVAASVNENSSLSFSNRDRQMFLYSE